MFNLFRFGLCLWQGKDVSLLYWLLRRLATDDDTGVLLQISECLMMCLETETMESTEKDKFLAAFYDHYMTWLAEPLMAFAGGEAGTGAGTSTADGTARADCFGGEKSGE